MTADELEAMLSVRIPEYAQSKLKAGIFTPENADRRARAEFDALLPRGVESPGQLLWTALDAETDEAVGILWLGLPTADRPQAWVYDVEVVETARGRGYGRALMLAAERELADRGVSTLGLNVFGHNAVARRLYESLGYVVTAQQMTKDVEAG